MKTLEPLNTYRIFGMLYKSRILKKGTFGACANSEGPDQCVTAQSDQGLRCQANNKLGTLESIAEQEMPNWRRCLVWKWFTYRGLIARL